MVKQKPTRAQDQRLDGAFLYLQSQVKKGNTAQAYTFFKNVVACESQLAREDERNKIQGD